MTASDWDDAAEQTKAYTANELNQYSAITIGSEIDSPEYDDDGNLLQISTDGTLMTCNGENRLSTVEIEGSGGDVNGDGTVDLADVIASLQTLSGMENITAYLDADLSTDGQIGLEEAVFGLQATAGIREAKAAQKLVFAYDYQGRRVSKLIFSRNADDTDWNTEPDKTVLFVWNGWNLIEEITQQGETEASRYFVSGLDLSQSFEGSGGIGGLLSLVDGSSAYYYLYDANGNVGQLVDVDDGGVAAHYEYDAFGKTVTAEGAYSEGNPFRFSSKYFDVETGFGYWGRRYYDPDLGRWLNRDPIWENGGVNLYGFVSNEPISWIDHLGFVKSITVSLYGNYPSEKAFERWGKRMAPKHHYIIDFGIDVIDKLKEASHQPPTCCIKKLNIFHHCYGYREYSGTYLRYGKYPDSVPLSAISSAETGFMVKKPINSQERAADISDLQAAIKNKDVRFCKVCSILFTGCRAAETGVPAALAKATGCKVTAAHGASSPELKKVNNKKVETGKWKSGPMYSEEKEKEPYTGWTEFNPNGTTQNIGKKVTVW